MQVNKLHIIYLVVVGLLIAALTITFVSLNRQKSKFVDQEELYNAVTGSIKTWKDKDSLNNAKIQIMQTEKAGDFLKLQNLEGVNLELQNLIKSQDKKIEDLTAALVIESNTIYTDTLRMFYPIGGDTIVFSKSVLLDSISNEWIDAMFGFNRGFSYLDVNIKNKYEIVMGFEGGNLFKRGIPYATITNLNPYTSTKEMRVYQVRVPKQKRFGLGFQAGFGGIYDIQHKSIGYGPYIGIGINYNVINW